ncbi:maleylpyruvate isomerase family mycothiol-dependent enzyme [Streptomyces armeniacus]|uniref:Maleylpyruvate isomerase family mycothiol-dependent enzyme n=1 Tax=Streptomyces armeniacus TaxID=83291 RepID=A0A345XUV1_9ACTN|nr:maleylpyruvate isomerase family mycothiol-dependent enzyme [Streptomyces armeniacus]AXK35417.1 maleylpyruvate isomerase family mycothiol-dependent enzyme [Streptomyces armeniacus]
MVSTSLPFERYRSEILRQTRLFRETLAGADPSAQVPSCPDWTLRELAVHLGGAHRWVHEIVRTRAQEEVPDEAVPEFEGPPPKHEAAADAAALDEWLAEGAELLAGALRDAGPEARLWTWSEEQSTVFWARRMTHETVVHRADACLAAGQPYEVAPEVAADCVDEWLDIVCSPEAQAYDEQLLQLRERAGDSLHLHATDTGGGEDGSGVRAEWLIELGPDGPLWHRTHGTATTALRGPLTDVLLVFYRRLAPDSDRVEVLGDPVLLDFWLERTSFGG